jgi:hypothetical protein
MVLPYDRCDVNRLLDYLHSAGFVLHYEVDGIKYIWVINFNKHQNPHLKEKIVLSRHRWVGCSPPYKHRTSMVQSR